MGKGAYGVVWKAIDRRQRRVVAIKKIVEAFHNAADAQRTYREIMVLKELNGHPNLVRILNVIRSSENRDIFLVYEHMDTDLHVVIKSGVCADEHKLFITYQILKGMAFLHQARVMHRDMKPSNVLVGSDCLVKIADFGLSRVYAEDCELTDYVATRWYRAPEILLGSTRYGLVSDMWGVGCTIAELYLGEPLLKGSNTINQIERILEFVGKPSRQDLEGINSTLAEDIVNGLAVKRRYPTVHYSAPHVKQLIEGLLTFNPLKRMTAEQALALPCFAKLRAWDSNPLQATPIALGLDDGQKLPLREYREEIYREIFEREKEMSKKWRKFLLRKLDM
jgi:mitogen-activated protein kinase 15